MPTTDSKLASEFIASPNCRKGRLHPITRVTIHHAVMVTTARVIAVGFTPATRCASATYCIGNDGSIVQCVREADTPQTSSSLDNDSRAITIEVANSSRKKPWPIGQEAMDSLIALLADICRRNPGLGHLRYTGDTSGNMTMHKWFSNTQCPGDYLAGKFPEIAQEVNARLDKDKITTTVYDLTAAGLPETLASNIVAEVKNAGYTATLTAREVEATDETEGYTKIMGETRATAEQLAAYIKQVRPGVEQSVIDMIPYYISEGEREGVRGDIAFAQSCIETGNFAFPPATCAVTLGQNNFAMMGVTGTFVQGLSFDTPQLGIRAQIQHLKAYASAEALAGECVDPRFGLVTRGSAPYVEWLGQRENPKGKGWATSAGYGAKILTVLGDILSTEAAAEQPETQPLALGGMVTLKANATIWRTNKSFASWVYNKVLYVRGISGDCITVSIYKSGAVTGCVDKKYLNRF